MSRRMLVAGNWKMYTTSGEGAVLVQDLAPLVEEWWDEVEIAVCPPFTGIKAVSTVIELDKLTISLGAQDVHWEAEGAFTGAIAPRMLRELRCDYVIVGHSERREYFGDTNETVNRKVHATFDAGMVPIMCVGETLEIREALETDTFVRTQVLEGAAVLPDQMDGAVGSLDRAAGAGGRPEVDRRGPAARGGQVNGDNDGDRSGHPEDHPAGTA